MNRDTTSLRESNITVKEDTYTRTFLQTHGVQLITNASQSNSYDIKQIN